MTICLFQLQIGGVLSTPKNIITVARKIGRAAAVAPSRRRTIFFFFFLLPSQEEKRWACLHTAQKVIVLTSSKGTGAEQRVLCPSRLPQTEKEGAIIRGYSIIMACMIFSLYYIFSNVVFLLGSCGLFSRPQNGAGIILELKTSGQLFPTSFLTRAASSSNSTHPTPSNRSMSIHPLHLAQTPLRINRDLMWTCNIYKTMKENL